MTTPGKPTGSANEASGGPAASCRLIVGIGASAGGLEALDRLFACVPADSGIAYVVVQHLAPQHTSMLAQILDRNARLPVVEVADGAVAEADHVYVIQPGTMLGIADGRFQVSGLGAERHGLIDAFLRALAADRGACAAGIVLSGSGADGTEGLRAIREHGGLTLVQVPGTAEYDAMPTSAIQAGVADAILRIDEMPARLLERVKELDLPHGGASARTLTAAPPLLARPPPASLVPSDEELAASVDRVCQILHQATGHDFSQYKRGTVLRRLRRRVLSHGAASVAEYVEFLATDPEEPALLAKDQLIGVTELFRDPEVFERLAASILPELVSRMNPKEGLRVWVPGCATGEEAYSIAILLAEALAAHTPTPPVQIFATDIDVEAISEARQGRFPASAAGRVSPERLARFFTKEGDFYRIGGDVRDMCVFSEHSLIRDPPFLGLDLISCRNLLIYLDADLQKKVIPVFHYALRPGGYLLLGLSEGLSGYPELFEPIDKIHRIFKYRVPLARPLVHFPLTTHPTPRPTPSSAHLLASAPAQQHALNAAFERVLLQEYVPPSAVVNEQGDVLCVAGLTGTYLQPQAGVLSTNILEIAHAGLRIEIRTALQGAKRSGKKVVREDVQVDVDGSPRKIRLTVRPMQGAKQAGLFVVVLQERSGASDGLDSGEPWVSRSGSETAMEQLEGELRATRANLRATIEDLESANEELKASNEEMLSTNEEMQSANEELQSSQEELKSVNEELATVNGELARKVDELGQANSDIQNLFAATEIATIFLDAELRVARFTPAAKRLFKLIDSDVGRPLSDLAPRFAGEDLDADVRDVLRSPEPLERQVQTLDLQAWYLLRILPYRVGAGIAGAVVTLADITRIKRVEEALRASEEKYRGLFDSIDEAFCVIEVVLDADRRPVDYRFLEVNRVFEKQTGIQSPVGRRMREIEPAHEEQWFKIFGEVARTGDPARFENQTPSLDRYFDVYAFPTGDPGQSRVAVLFDDITDRKRREAERERLVRDLSAAQGELNADVDGMIRLLKIGSLFLEEGNLASVLGEVVDAAIAISGADRGNIQLLNKTTGDLEIAAQRGFDEAWLSRAAEAGEWGASGTVLARRQREIVENVEQSPALGGSPALRALRDAGIRAFQSTPLIGRLGEPIGILSTHRRTPGRPGDRALRLLDLLARQVADILERAQADALRTANLQLVDADRRKDQFLGMLSHELRNPLSAIRSCLDILDRTVAGGEQASRAQTILRRQTDHLTRLVEDLLDITRLTGGKVRLQRVVLDLGALARRAVDDHRWPFEHNGIEISVRTTPGEIRVNVDPTRISQVLGNLLENAAKFTPRGGRTTVSVAADNERKLAILRVQDTGPGIAPELLPRVFEPFTQAETTPHRNKGGLGLGLAVVKGLIEMHGGTVHATTDSPDRGATFTIALPLETERQILRGAHDAVAGPSKRRVLVIDDNIDSAATLAESLALDGHTVDIAHSGPDGIEKARSFHPAVVICDIGLPGMDGYEVARTVRADPDLAGVALVALSGYARPDDVKKAKDAGFVTFLAKPASLTTIERALAELES